MSNCMEDEISRISKIYSSFLSSRTFSNLLNERKGTLQDFLTKKDRIQLTLALQSKYTQFIYEKDEEMKPFDTSIFD